MKKTIVILSAAFMLLGAAGEEGVKPKLFDDLNANMVADPDDSAGSAATEPAVTPGNEQPDIADIGETPPDETYGVTGDTSPTGGSTTPDQM